MQGACLDDDRRSAERVLPTVHCGSVANLPQGGSTPLTNTYKLPQFLEGRLDHDVYIGWLNEKAQTHVRRDRKRWNQTLSKSDYKQAIHTAVLHSEGQDHYTGERLEWCRIGKYDNLKAQERGSEYRREFALLPTVDHENPESREPVFRICGLRTNDCKSDLTVKELKEFCKRFLRAQRWTSLRRLFKIRS